jgi:hypothetical protein
MKRNGKLFTVSPPFANMIACVNAFIVLASIYIYIYIYIYTSGNPCLQGTDDGLARVGWAPLAHRHTQSFFFFCPSVINN